VRSNVAPPLSFNTGALRSNCNQWRSDSVQLPPQTVHCSSCMIWCVTRAKSTVGL